MHASQQIKQVAIQQALTDLRDTHRIKQGVDFAITVKYGDIHLMCSEVFKETIQEVLEKNGLSALTVFVY